MPVPKYQIIKLDIKRRIQNGEMAAHSRLDSRHEMEKRYGCGWSTVHRAISELILEGVVYAEQGRGTFVAPAALKKRETINVLFLNAVSSWHDSLTRMMAGMRDVAHQEGMAISYKEVPHDGFDHWDIDRHIVVVPSVSDRSFLQEARDEGVRFIVLGSDYPEDPTLPCVNAGTARGVEDAVSHLIEAGHRHIGLLGIIPEFPNYQRELEGYQRALARSGLPFRQEYILSRSASADDLGRSVQKWFESHPEVTAVFVGDYTTGLAVLSYARREKIKVPEHLSIFCMDELPTSDLLSVPLSSIVQPFYELGRLAAHSLLNVLNGADLPSTTRLPCTLTHRDSVGAPIVPGASKSRPAVG